MQKNKSMLLWRCRRGMLELDLVLKKFITHNHEKLSDNELNDFLKLMELEDPVLFNLLVTKTAMPDKSLERIVQSIIQSNRN